MIALGYGETQGKTRRSKSARQVTKVEGTAPLWFDKGVEMALLAPTAINQQKFMITLQKNEKVIITDQGGPYSKVDLGIVKYHFEVGSRHTE